MTQGTDLHPLHPARWVAEQLCGCGFTNLRILVFTRASTLILANEPDGSQVVVKSGFGSNHVLDELPEELRAASYGFYWYRALTPEERLLTRKDFQYEVATALECSGIDSVVPVLQTGHCDRFDWYTMPYLPEGNFQQCVSPTNDIQLLRSRWAILSDIAGALHALHEYGVVHRDVYAENVLISHGRGFVTDFGASRHLDEPRGPSTRGPEVHWAPEYLTDYAHAHSASDVYSLAVLTHRATFGDLPRISPPDVTFEMPSYLRDAIFSALSRDSRQRPSMNAFRDSLIRAAQ